MPAFNAALHEPEAHREAVEVWEENRDRLASLLRVGAISLGDEGLQRLYGRSQLEIEVSKAYLNRRGNEPDIFYCFQFSIFVHLKVKLITYYFLQLGEHCLI